MITYLDMQFSEIKQFDGHVFSFNNGINGTNICGYTTVIPVSNAEFRKSKGDDPVKVVITAMKSKTMFSITSDFGKTDSVLISNDEPKVIAKAILDICNCDREFPVKFKVAQ